MIVIVDYGLGNLASIENMFNRIGVQSIISSNPEQLENADKLILPGVGSFDTGARYLINSGFGAIIKEKVNAGTPILGICLGMQLLAKKSEEGSIEGLGLIDATVKKFDKTNDVKVPHMGWNYVYTAKTNKLIINIKNKDRFYFVHSYYVICSDSDDILLRTKYGNMDFVSAFARDNIFGVQFHPEKSHRFGMTLLSNFATM